MSAALRSPPAATALAIGVVLAVSLGIVLESWTLGIAIGVGVGVALGWATQSRSGGDESDDQARS